MILQTAWISSLEKVFFDGELNVTPISRATALQGEVFSFQLAVRNRTAAAGQFAQVTVKFRTDCALPVEIREVESVPVDIPCNLSDSVMVRRTPGLYPDLLTALPERCTRLAADQWRTFWVTVRVPADCAGGEYPVTVSMENVLIDGTPIDDAEVVSKTFTLEVLPVKPEKQKLICYQWFYCDCLATYYKVPVWSDEHFRIIENFVRSMVEHGGNMLMVPLWSVPLDTEIGAERPTVQLLKIRRDAAGKYTFDFSLLERYLDMAARCGVEYYGMSHAFTQWGAAATPKIVAEVDGTEQQIFGWDVPADSRAYADFLKQLMKELLPLLRKRGLAKNVFFSVSDEPREEHLEAYAKASGLMTSVLEEFPIQDALSSIRFYENGLVKNPVPSNNHIEDFYGKVSPLWTYYCISQERDVPNRFIAMPSIRNRVLGVLCYLYDVAGFLQWGYNFYYSVRSQYPVNPYRDTCAGNWTPGGDAFVVYPGADGAPEDSLRHEVFHEAIQDLNALQTLEKKIGREAVTALIHEGLTEPLKMNRYPLSADWLLQLRERVNRALAQA